jgi:photosystem II stability/assembly factor-like uncharacterized protein
MQANHFKFSLKEFILLLFLLIGIVQCTIEEGHVPLEQAHTKTSDNINQIQMLNDSLGIAVGGSAWDRGLSLTTNDGGATWHSDSVSNKGLLGLDFNGQDLVCVGIDGYFLKYDNTGETWNFHRLAYWDVLRDVVLTHDKNAIAVGGIAFHKGVIYHINENNEVDTLIQLGHELRSIAQIDDQKYIAVGFGAIYVSTNQGYDWQLLTINGDFYQSVDFADQKNGMIVGEAGSILRTSDGGNTWVDLRDGNDIFLANGAFRDIIMVSIHEAYVVGDEGLVWKSMDNGESWTQLSNENSDPFQTISYTSSHIIIGGNNGKIYRILR